MFEENTFCTGAAFVPNNKGGLHEDYGWIVAFVHNEDTNTSQVINYPKDHFLLPFILMLYISISIYIYMYVYKYLDYSYLCSEFKNYSYFAH